MSLKKLKSKNYHYKLSADDKKPKCALCDNDCSYYCNMNDLYYCEKHVIGHDENESWLFITQWFYLFTLDDSFRNQCIDKIALKITEEKIPTDEPASETLEYLQKFAITLGIDISNTEEVVNEAFLYLAMKNAKDIDPLTKGDEFGAGFS